MRQFNSTSLFFNVFLDTKKKCQALHSGRLSILVISKNVGYVTRIFTHCYSGPKNLACNVNSNKSRMDWTLSTKTNCTK